MPAHKGGRGIKAPYTTTHVRVPVDLVEKVEELKQHYFDTKTTPQKPLTRNEAISLAREILKQKKSARISLSKLLTGLYGSEIEL